MRLKSAINHYCEVVGRASAVIAFAGMGSLVLTAIALDVLR
jgi:hypothetical protein